MKIDQIQERTWRKRTKNLVNEEQIISIQRIVDWNYKIEEVNTIKEEMRRIRKKKKDKQRISEISIIGIFEEKILLLKWN